MVNGGPGRFDKAECLLTETQLQPKHALPCVAAQGLLHQFQREGELPVVGVNARRQPTNEPVPGRKSERLFKTIIGPLLCSGHLYIAPSQPDVRRFALLPDGCVGVGYRRYQIAQARQRHGFGRQQFRFVREAFQRFVRPFFRFGKFVQLD